MSPEKGNALVTVLCDGHSNRSHAIESARQLIAVADAVETENLTEGGKMGLHRVLVLADELLEYAGEPAGAAGEEAQS